MFFKAATAAALLLTLAPSAMAVGRAKVISNCDGPVYFASVAQSIHASMEKLPLSGYSEEFSKQNVGVSIKLSPSATGKVTQFEITWAGNVIYYDISNIDGNPFADGGMELVPSMAGAAGYPTCQTVSCPAGESTCTAAYNQPDDTRTMVCPDASDLTMTLCPGGSSNSTKREEPFAHRHYRIHARHFK